MSRKASAAPPPLEGRTLETRLLDVELIDASRRNGHSRLAPAALGELKASIAAQGILQPVIVRPLEDSGFELVSGHRRLECARQLGLAEVPAQIMSLTEAEAREVQLVENLQRESLTPLDEAEAVAGLLELVSLDEAAARLGRSRGYLLGRMLLNRLPQEAKLALAAGTLSLAVALLVARIPDEELREQLAKEVQEGRQVWYEDEFTHVPLSVAEARARFERTMLALKRAPFDTADPMLLVGVPSCTACPHRSGNALDLFGDVADADTCTNPGCYARKREAAWSFRRDEAKAKGVSVLPDKRAKRILDRWSGQPTAESGFVSPAAHVGRDGDARTWAQVVKAAKVKLPAYAVRHPESDKPMPLLRVDDLRELLPKEEKARLALPKASAPKEEKAPEAPAKPAGPSERAIFDEAQEELESALRESAAGMPPLPFLRALVGALFEGYTLAMYLRLIGVSEKLKPAKLEAPSCQAMLALWAWRETAGQGAAEAFGVNLKPLLAAAKARLEQQAKEQGAEEPAPAGPGGKKAPGKRRAAKKARR